MYAVVRKIFALYGALFALYARQCEALLFQVLDGDASNEFRTINNWAALNDVLCEEYLKKDF